jgi:hypothetical protein
MCNIENISPTYRQIKNRQEFVAAFTFIFYLQVRDGKRKHFLPQYTNARLSHKSQFIIHQSYLSKVYNIATGNVINKTRWT